MGRCIKRLSNGEANPVFDATLNNVNKSKSTSFNDNFDFEWYIVEGIRLTGRFAYTYGTTHSDVFVSPKSSQFEDQQDDKDKGSYDYSSSSTHSMDGNIVVNAWKSIDKHMFTLVLGANMQDNKEDNKSFSATGFLSDKLTNLDFAMQYREGAKPRGSVSQDRLIGFFANASYAYDNRYLFDFSYRTDGSSKFGKKNRFAPFWSAGIGWNIHNEKFWGNPEWLTQAKIRSSVGYTGNVTFSPYQAQTTYQYSSDNIYLNGVGADIIALGNEDLKWQRKFTVNLGCDLDFWEGRFSLTGEYFREYTKDVLMDISLPPSLGFIDYKENFGEMENKGWSLNLRTQMLRDTERELYWSLAFGTSDSKNKIKKITDKLGAMNDENNKNETKKPVPLYEEGESLDALKAVPSLGIDPETGKEVFVKKDGSLTTIWDYNDKVVCGTTDPKFRGTLNSFLTFKGISLNMSFNFQWGGQTYNQTLGTTTYKEKVKPIVDKALGGTLRLFVQKVYEGSYFSRNEEVVLHANANLPNGSTLEQMNALIKRMETYLSEFKEIKQFQTSVESARRASIHIYFTKEHQKSGFPYTLKANMISKALQLGGGNWSIYGLQDQGFSNDVRENAGSFRVKMYGYNYDALYDWVEKLKAKLLSHRRIREVTIGSDFSWWKDDYMEFYFNLNKQRMAEEGIGAGRLFSAIHPIYGRNMEIGSVMAEGGTEKIKLSSRQSEDRDVWAMQFYPFQIGEREYKLSELATVEKGQMPQEVAKENQQYRLCLQYEYIGSSEQGNKLLKKDLEEFNEILPMGYTAKSEDNNWSWGGKDNQQYRLLLIVIAILFNSLKQPLAIIFVIPVSYIGVFLTFYWFKLNFDQGGFASFVLLCGITVNASIYILNEYNSVRKRFPRLSPLRAYVKAWNTKVIPIFLTVTSTILGFVPFMVGMEKEGFWFPLAAGTIGGLIMSVIGVFIFLPVFTLKKKCLVKPKAML